MHQSIFVQMLKISLERIENNGCMCFNLSGKEQGKERGCTIQYIYFKILYLVYLPPIYIIIRGGEGGRMPYPQDRHPARQ